MKRALAALWYGGSIFAIGALGSFLVGTQALDFYPAWLSLGASAAVGLTVGLYYFFTERADDRRYEAEQARGLARARRQYFGGE